MKENWCIFDLDGTLLLEDSYIPFLLGWLKRYPYHILYLVPLPYKIFVYFLRHKDRAFIKTAFLKAFMKGAPKSKVEAFARSFWISYWPKKQNKPLIAELVDKKRAGNKIVIVTGSFYFYVRYLVDYLPVDLLIASQEQWENGKLTGELDGPNCLGCEKVKRIEAELGKTIAELNYEAYSDCLSDQPLMEHAKKAWLVKDGQKQNWPK